MVALGHQELQAQVEQVVLQEVQELQVQVEQAVHQVLLVQVGPQEVLVSQGLVEQVVLQEVQEHQGQVE